MKKKKTYKDQRSQVSTKCISLTNDIVNVDSSTLERDIDQISTENTALLKTKEEIIKIQKFNSM